MPLINNVYHKKALIMYGYSAETFVDSIWHITSNFDIVIPRYLKGPLKIFIPYFLLVYCIFRFKCLYIYFVGGPLRTTFLLKKIEPFLFKIAKIKIILLSYGADVHTFTRTTNFALTDVYSQDYPNFKFFSLLMKNP